LAAVPSIGRASRIDGAVAPEADVTRALYEEYANQIFRYCLHQLGSREEAEDAVQSTFLNAFRGIKRGVVPELEAAWLFKIAHNVCLSRRRSAWRRGRVESPADFEVIEELTPAPSRRTDELIGLQEVLEGMPETQRRAILLREWQGLSYREIAAELELSQGAVETLIFRARRSLASGLEQPPESKRRRVARALDWGNLVAGLKAALIGGSVAAKVAVTVAVVSATTVVAAEPLQHQRHHVANVVPKVHVAVRVTAHVSAPVRQTISSVAPTATAPAVYTSRHVSRVHRAAPVSPEAAVSADEARPPSEQPASALATNEQSNVDGHGGGDNQHSGRTDRRTTSGVQPSEQQPPASGSSDQSAQANDGSTQDWNRKGDHRSGDHGGDHGGGKSPGDNGGDG
jgi:RNA polymerase sigma factor (sigma-70 family)